MNNLFSKLLLLSILIAPTAISADESEALTKVRRSTCILFPQIIEFEKQILGVHYSIVRDDYSGCEKTSEGYNKPGTCSDFIKTEFKYVYKRVTTYDYYNSIGELITSTVENWSEVIGRRPFDFTVGEWKDLTSIYVEPVDDEAKDLIFKQFNSIKSSISIEIYKKIFEGAYAPCADSYYK